VSSGGAPYLYRLRTDGDRFSCVDSIDYFKTAIVMLCEAGRFSNAAKLQKQIAEVYEGQDNKEDALEAYRQAADYFSGENQQSSANNMLLKVAQLSAQLGRYDSAMEIYESIAKASMDSNLLKFNAKNHLLNAGICALATSDLVLVQMKAQEYQEIDYTFGDSREGKFLQVRTKCEHLDFFYTCILSDVIIIRPCSKRTRTSTATRSRTPCTSLTRSPRLSRGRFRFSCVSRRELLGRPRPRRT
jgi:hypothetical protein